LNNTISLNDEFNNVENRNGMVMKDKQMFSAIAYSGYDCTDPESNFILGWLDDLETRLLISPKQYQNSTRQKKFERIKKKHLLNQ
jgi:hypothetical protein